MDYKYLIDNLSTVIWHATLLVSAVGILKLLITNWFLYKITVSKRTEIRCQDGERSKTVSYSHYNENPDDAIKIFKNVDYFEDDDKKAS